MFSYFFLNLHYSNNKVVNVSFIIQKIITTSIITPNFFFLETNIPMGANVWRNKLFISVPRRRLGVPSTLNYVPLDSPQKHNVPLIPYPNWEMNTYPDPTNSGQNFVSIYRVGIDVCDRLWFVDTGLVEVLTGKLQ